MRIDERKLGEVPRRWLMLDSMWTLPRPALALGLFLLPFAACSPEHGSALHMGTGGMVVSSSGGTQSPSGGAGETDGAGGAVAGSGGNGGGSGGQLSQSGGSGGATDQEASTLMQEFSVYW